MFCRNGESPIPIIAASSPGDCFYIALEATRIALKYKTPIMILSDNFIANSSEPWKIPDEANLPNLVIDPLT